MWSKNYSSCTSCKKTDQPHASNGLCMRCYQRLPEHREKKHAWYLANIVGTPRAQLAREKEHFDGNRQEVLQRDGYRCTVCGSKKSLVVHHMDGSGRTDTDRDSAVEQLTTLCRACHVREHFTIDRWSKFYDSCIVCGRTDRRHNAKGLCRHCYSLQHTPPSFKGLWSRRHGNCCKVCGTTAVQHKGNGLCQTCYGKARHEKNKKVKI